MTNPLTYIHKKKKILIKYSPKPNEAYVNRLKYPAIKRLVLILNHFQKILENIILTISYTQSTDFMSIR